MTRAPRARPVDREAPAIRCACLMMEKNESTLLLPWVRYHGALFGLENLYVFDNGSTESDTLLALDMIEPLGVHVDRSHDQRVDFATKGAVLGSTMAKLRDSGRFDFLIPLDCDEFFAVQDGDSVSVEPSHILARLAELKLETRVPVVRFNYLNMLGSKDHFLKEHALKTFVQADGFLDLDHGFHFGRSSLSTEMVDTDFVYIHCHSKPYEVIVRHSREKLSFWCDVDDPDALSALEASNGPGWHLVRYLQMTEQEYLSSFQTKEHVALPAFATQLDRVGADSSFLLGQISPAAIRAPQARPRAGLWRLGRPERQPGNGVIVLGPLSPHLGPIIKALGAAGIVIGDPADFFMDRRWAAGLSAGATERVKHWLLTRAAASGQWACWLPEAGALDEQAIDALRWPRIIQIVPQDGFDTNRLARGEPAYMTECRWLAETGLPVLHVQTPLALTEPFLLAEAILDFIGIDGTPSLIAEMIETMMQPPINTDYEGWVDGADRSTVTGWCWLAHSIFRPTVEVFVDGTKRRTGIADMPRGDLAEAGKGDGRFGYSVSVEGLDLKDTSVIDVFIAGTGYKLRNSGHPLSVFLPDGSM